MSSSWAAAGTLILQEEPSVINVVFQTLAGVVEVGVAAGPAAEATIAEEAVEVMAAEAAAAAVMVIIVGAVEITTLVGVITGEVVVVTEGIRKAGMGTMAVGGVPMEVTKEEKIAAMVRFPRLLHLLMEGHLGTTPFLQIPMVGM